jgi:hypothetical protein
MNDQVLFITNFTPAQQPFLHHPIFLGYHYFYGAVTDNAISFSRFLQVYTQLLLFFSVANVRLYVETYRNTHEYYAYI